MNALHRSVAAALAIAFAGHAAAQDPAALQAEQALQALSARYQQIWPTLSPAERQAFSAEERAWLNRGRWDEQKQCVARLGANSLVPEETRAAQCQQQVVERRLQQLQVLRPAALQASVRS